MLCLVEGPRAPALKMLTKTVRSRFSHEVGEKVEGCTILEKRVVIPPNEEERRRGVYDYEVDGRKAAFVPGRCRGSFQPPSLGLAGFLLTAHAGGNGRRDPAYPFPLG
jgi:hypothetical protein